MACYSNRRRSRISSDDPNALQELTTQLEQLKRRHVRMRAINDAHIAFLKDPATLDAADLTPDEKRIIREYKPPYPHEPHPIAPYELSRSNANIKRVEGRIAELGKQAGRETTEERIEEIGLTIRCDAGDNRVHLIMDDKPSEEIRRRLKRIHGFKWSPTRTAWVRQWNTNGQQAARNYRDETLRAAAAASKAESSSTQLGS
jgi:hypothetical protein